MRATTATVNLSAIEQNLEVAVRHAPGSKIVAIIKADAYGHGAVEVAGILQTRVPALAVAILEEAIELQDAGIDAPILVLQGVGSASEFAEAAARDLWLMLHNPLQVEWVLSARLSRPVRVWVKANTGMNRLGLAADTLDRVCDALADSANVHPDRVLCSQLACADDPDHSMTEVQVRRLHGLAKRHGWPLSIANSAAIMAWPDSHAEWNRPGYMLYGNSPFGSFESGQQGLAPAMRLCSEVVALHDLAPGDGVGYGQTWVARKPSRIATVAIGYGDGYPRHAPNGTPVLVNGRRVPLAGTVSMDFLTVDITGSDEVQLGDPVELWGQALSVNEVAASAGTIGYELLTGLTARVPRVYAR